MMDKLYNTVAVVGPGLIGGSIGLGLRRRDVAERVVGIGRRACSLDEALEVGAVDVATMDMEEGVRGADLVILATPIRAISAVIPTVARYMHHNAVLTEVASTKRSVITTIRTGLAERSDIIFIPTHPMAGSEQRGATHASDDLFEDSVCIFTPLPETAPSALKKLKDMWKTLGTVPYEMTPEEHDRTVATVSHLPHLAASCVARCVNAREGQFAGGGFIDTTRIASGDPRLWRDICESNADEVHDVLAHLIEQLQTLDDLFSEGDFDRIQCFLADAKEKRDLIVEHLGD